MVSSATDRATNTRTRGSTVLGQLADNGGEASGMLGADAPLLAFEDAITDFAPDHRLIALRAGRTWMAGAGAVEQLQQRFGLPMTAFSR